MAFFAEKIYSFSRDRSISAGWNGDVVFIRLAPIRTPRKRRLINSCLEITPSIIPSQKSRPVCLIKRRPTRTKIKLFWLSVLSLAPSCFSTRAPFISFCNARTSLLYFGYYIFLVLRFHLEIHTIILHKCSNNITAHSFSNIEARNFLIE